jgi:hypothetical protein
LILTGAIGYLGTGFLPAAKAGELRAGASRVPITPLEREFPYQEGGERPFVGIHDDVYTRALVLDDGVNRTAIVSIEVTAIPDAAQIVKEVARAAGVPETRIMVAATHTHNVPLVFFHSPEPNRIQKQEIDRIHQSAVQAVHDAISHLESARIAFASGEAWVNVNNGEQAGLKTGYDPKGPSEKTLDVVRVERVSGEPLALMVNYAAHAEVMFRSATKDGGYEVSGDLPGAVSRMLEGSGAGAPVVLYLSGAEGDQLTVYKSLHPEGQLPAKDEGAAGWGLLAAQSYRLGAAVLDVVRGMPQGSSTATIRAESSSVSCPGQRLRVDNQTGKATAQDTPPATIPLTLIRINDIAIAGIGGDVASDIGRAIRLSTPAPHTVVTTMLAGAVGYILSDASYDRPGHGLAGSPLKAGCAERALVDGFSALAKK